MNVHTVKSWCLLMTVSLIWGISFLFTKKALIFLSPLEVSSFRIASAALVLIPFAIRGFKVIPRDKLFLVLVIGFTGNFFPAFLISLAQTNLDSGIAGVLISPTPLFTLITGFVFFKQKIKLLNIIGVGLGLWGTAFLILGEFNINAFKSINSYSFFIILSSVFYAISLNLVKNKLADIPPISLTAMSFMGCGFFSMIVLLTGTDFLGHLGDFSTNFISIFYVVILGVVNTALAMIIFNKIIKMTSPLLASSVTYLIPVVSLLVGFLDGEKLIFYQFICMGFIFSGIYLVNKK